MKERGEVRIDPLALPIEAYRIHGGETGAALYRWSGHVIKRAEDGRGLDEIANNIAGYTGIAEAGGGRLLPDGIEWGMDDSNGWIVMPDLGRDMTVRDLAGENLEADYEVLMREVVRAVSESARSDSGGQLAGLGVLKEQLRGWLEKIEVAAPGLISPSLPATIDVLDLSKAVSGISSVMIQDFTPDNVFVDGTRARFIDPWLQPVYRGTFIPSLAQYRANAVEVRQFPSAVKMNDSMVAALEQIATILHLTDDQLSVQRQLGEALQYSLSAYVRLEREPERAARYIKVVEDRISSIRELLTR